MSAASPTRSTKLNHTEVAIQQLVPPFHPWPAGDTLTQNTSPTHKHGGERQVNPKRT